MVYFVKISFSGLGSTLAIGDSAGGLLLARQRSPGGGLLAGNSECAEGDTLSAETTNVEDSRLCTRLLVCPALLLSTKATTRH